MKIMIWLFGYYIIIMICCNCEFLSSNLIQNEKKNEKNDEID